jgi:hypothetical protein
MSSPVGWGKGFGKEFAGIYRKKRSKRSNAHDIMDITFKSFVHALRLSGIKIPKNVFLPNYHRLSIAVRKKMCMAARKKMCMTVRKMVKSKIIGMLRTRSV